MATRAAPATRSGERRRALLQAAAEVFFERGYAAASIDAIIARAGGSKRNIYDQFGGKAGLFAAIVAQNADEALATTEVEDPECDLRDSLLALGRRLLDLYMSPTVLGVYRTVVAEAHRDPDLARTFYEIGPGRTAERVREVLERAAVRGEVRVADPAQQAEHFVGLLRDNLHLQVVLGLRPAPGPDEADAVVRSAVGLFLDGLRPR